MFRKLIIISAWVSIAMVFYGTMTDVGFVYSLYFKLSPFLMHTDMRSFARFEHIIAFACLNLVFSSDRILVFVGFKLFDKAITKINLEAEIAKGNVAAAVLSGAAIIALAIIIAAAMS